MDFLQLNESCGAWDKWKDEHLEMVSIIGWRLQIIGYVAAIAN